MSRIESNLRRVRERIEAAAERVGRDPRDVDICAVTKQVQLPEIREVVRCGARILGESRVHAAGPKIREGVDLAGEISWHMIGHVQGNKARKAVELFDVIESVDSLSLARRLSGFGKERDEPVPILVEVLTSTEGTKGGFPVEEVEDVVAELRELPGLSLKGMMTMAPLSGDEGRVRSSFAMLRDLRDRLPEAEALAELSMGMTGDFEIAVEEGSTLVRVGTAIFG